MKEKIHLRATMLEKSRAFFKERGVVEVDPPIMTSASIDAHIDPIEAGGRYLHTSPEYAMKRLLANGSGDIYSLCHVFRKGEIGRLHREEFMMAEWYRLGFTFEEMIEETLAYIRLFVQAPTTVYTYEEAFQKFAGIDFRTKTDDELNIILGTQVEPQLQNLVVIRDYPASQCALAQTKGEFAERFEVYCDGIELANGYHELADSAEQRKRFEAGNAERLALGKEALPIDEAFLKALDKLPDCCGVAVGFDRLMMLHASHPSSDRSIHAHLLDS